MVRTSSNGIRRARAAVAALAVAGTPAIAGAAGLPWARDVGETLAAAGPPAWIAGAAVSAALAILAIASAAARRDGRRRIAALRDAVAERLDAQTALGATERRLQALVEGVPACVLTIGLGGRIVTTNARGVELFGAGCAEDLHRRPFLDLVAPADREHAAGTMALAFGGEARRFEFAGVGPEPRALRASLIPIRDADGLVSDLTAVVEDLTERRRWESGLRECAREIERHAWYRRGLADLRAQLRGEPRARDIADRALDVVCEHLGVPTAVLYLREGSALRLAASRARAAAAEPAAEIALGEGLVGQVAADGAALVVGDLPAGYMRVRSGLGEAAPRQLALVPIVGDGEVLGVLELASLRDLDAHELEFLETAGVDLGYAVSAAAARRRSAALVDGGGQPAADRSVRRIDGPAAPRVVVEIASPEAPGAAGALRGRL